MLGSHEEMNALEYEQAERSTQLLDPQNYSKH